MAVSRSQVCSDWGETIDDFLIRCRGAGREPKTVRYYRTQLGLLRTWAESRGISLCAFRARHFHQYRVYRMETGGRSGKGVSKATLHHDTICARMFFGFAAHGRYIREDPLAGMEKELRVKLDKTKRPMPSADAIAALIRSVETCWNPDLTPARRFVSERERRFYQTRDTAILLVLAETGARLGEVLSLTTDRFFPNARDERGRPAPYFLVPASVAKDDEDREVPIYRSLKAIRAYLDVKREVIKWWNDDGVLFANWTGGRVDEGVFGKAFRRYRTRAGLKDITIHSLKHYAATKLTELDINIASDITGTSIATLKRYYVHQSREHRRDRFVEADTLGAVLKV